MKKEVVGNSEATGVVTAPVSSACSTPSIRKIVLDDLRVPKGALRMALRVLADEMEVRRWGRASEEDGEIRPSMDVAPSRASAAEGDVAISTGSVCGS